MADRPFLTAEWRNLLMVNYAVEPTLLEPHVPAGTGLDMHQGTCYLSLVAFQFRNTRLLGMAIPFHHTFEEMNLRCYVRRQVGGETRRAVVFIREVVPRRAIALVARAVYNEPYIALPMRSRIGGEPLRVEYSWRLGGLWHSVAASAAGAAAATAEGSQEQFITEHYWGYTRQRDGGTIEYRVEHPPWRVWPADRVQLDADLERLYGPALARAMTSATSAFIADGSAVSVSRPRRLPMVPT